MGHRTLRTPFVLALAFISLLALASTASADQVLCATGPAAGQCEKPRGVAVDTSTGRVYATDTENNRIDVFDEAGAFLFAFGWSVNATTPEEKLQTCTTATGCQKGKSGSGAGQFGVFDRGGIAVDSSSHAVYVTEANHRLQKFDAEGHFVWMAGGEVDTVTHANLCTVAANCGAGKEAKKEAGKEEGRFFETLGGGLPVAVGPGGVVEVADSRKIGSAESEGFNTRVQRFEPSGAYLGPQVLLSGTLGRVQSLAVDSGGNLYLSNDAPANAVRKYEPNGNLASAWGEGGEVLANHASFALTLDPVGDLFVADATTNKTEILRFDPTGAESLAFFGAGTLETKSIALAFHHTAGGDLYAAEEGSLANPARAVQLTLPSPGPLIVPGSTKASRTGSVRATLEVEFNAEGKASHARFEYITKAAYEADGNSFGAGAKTLPDTPITSADFANHKAQAIPPCNSATPLEASCLTLETTYYLRAKAINADGEVESERAEFTTLPPLQIDATWASEVGTDGARLHAQVNPLSIHATAHFEYVDDAHFQSEGGFASPHTQISPGTIDFGSGEASLARATQLTALQPDTTYHYRLLASDSFFPPVPSPPHTFTTFALPSASAEECPANEAFRTAASAALSDCRAYELVTPLDKSNGDVLTRINGTGFQTNLDQSSAEGSGFTYSSYRAFADPQSALYTNQFLAARHERGEPEEGWSSAAIDPPRGLQFRSEFENEYRAFSADLSDAWLLQEGEPTLDACAPAGFADLYRRASADGSYHALSCAHPSHHFEELAGENPSQKFVPDLQGTSADGSHAVFRINDALTPGASGAGKYQVYESTGAGVLHLVSVLPDGEASEADSSAGSGSKDDVLGLANWNRFSSLLHAVSDSGTRVFWSTGFSGLGPLYLRLNADQAQSKVEEGECKQPAKACTVPVSETVTPQGAFFQAANPQGTKALFTVQVGPLKDNLYEFDSEANPPASHLIAKGVLNNILGASEDLSRVYYASEEATAPQQAEGAVKGKPNLYLYDEGSTRFLATLSSGGEGSDVDNLYGQPTSIRPIERTARVSPDGQSLVFMSKSKELSEETAGYDNTDLTSPEECGKAKGICDAEVYLYDATANAGAGALRCLSCNPSGSRPLGREIGKGIEGRVGLFAAAAIPRFETQSYQPRYLSEDGRRVFFNSFDSLVLGDTNGKEDAYLWEEAGTGGCNKESPTFAAASEGCLSLLSSGQSPFDSEFLDASASGSDAFFTTAEGLLPQDYGLIDVYDARVEGGFPPPPPPPAACEGEACQSPPQAPNDPTPASAAILGAGNVHEEAPARCARGKAHRKGRCVAKKHRAHKRHNARANHNRRAGR